MARKKKAAKKESADRVKLPMHWRSKAKTGGSLTMEKLHEIVVADAKGKRDLTLKKRNMRFVPSTAKDQSGGHGNMLELDGEVFEFTKHAWKQFCRMMGFPSEYALKVDADERHHMVKYWQRIDPDAALMLRLRDLPANGQPAVRTVRGVVKPTFSRFDNVQIMEHLARVLERREHVLRAVTLDDHGLHVSLTDRGLFDTAGDLQTIERLAKVTKGADPIAVGMHMRSSEVDAYPFEIDQEVYRLVCTNGMMGWAPQAVFKKSRQWGDILMFRDACSDAFREIAQLTDRTVTQLRASRDTTYDRGPKGHERVLKSVFKTYSLTAGGNMDEVLMRWDRHPSGDPVHPNTPQPDRYSKFGLVDSLTRTAQTLPDRQEQHKWEVAAGRYLAAVN